MRANVLLTILILTAFPGMTSGQKPSERKLFVSGAGISYGYHTTDYIFGTIDQFRLLYPESELLGIDYSEFNQNRGFWVFNSMHSPMVTSLTLGMGLRNRDDDGLRSNPRFQAGLSYHGGNLLEGSYWIKKVHVVDSLYDASTMSYKYVDSIHYRDMEFQHATDQLRADISVVLTINPVGRFYLYSGLGLSAGIPLLSVARIEYKEGYDIRTRTINGMEYYNQPRPGAREKNVKEIFHRCPSVIIMPYFPAGVSFRLGKRSELLQQIHIFYEQVNGVSITTVPGGENFTSHRIQHSIGVRIVRI